MHNTETLLDVLVKLPHTIGEVVTADDVWAVIGTDAALQHPNCMGRAFTKAQSLDYIEHRNESRLSHHPGRKHGRNLIWYWRVDASQSEGTDQQPEVGAAVP